MNAFSVFKLHMLQNMIHSLTAEDHATSLNELKTATHTENGTLVHRILQLQCRLAHSGRDAVTKPTTVIWHLRQTRLQGDAIFSQNGFQCSRISSHVSLKLHRRSMQILWELTWLVSTSFSPHPLHNTQVKQECNHQHCIVCSKISQWYVNVMYSASTL